MTVTTPTEWTTADWKLATDKAATLAAALSVKISGAGIA